MRDVLLLKTIALLKEKGFAVETFLHAHSCFDIAAKKSGVVFAIKVLNNIDSLREEQCLELKKMGALFNAIPLVLGEKTKAFSLEENRVYERYGITVLNSRGFENLLEKNFPSIKYFKGKEIVELDSEKLHRRRKELGFTLEELAEKIDSTIESIHRYEKGANISLGKAEELEDLLGTSLIKKINLFEEIGESNKGADIFEEQIDDDALKKIQDFGVKIAIFRHAPFMAGASKKETLIIGKGTGKKEIKKKALELEHAKHVFASGPVIFAREFKAKAIGSVPIIEEEELQSMSKFRDLEEMIKERARKK